MLKRSGKISSFTYLPKIIIHSVTISADAGGRKLWSLPSKTAQYHQGVERYGLDDSCSSQELVVLVDFRVPRLSAD